MTYRVPEDVITREMDGELVLLDLRSEMYFGLDAIGAKIVAGIAADKSLEQIAASLAAEFDADSSTIEADAQELIDELAAKGLIDRID